MRCEVLAYCFADSRYTG